MNININTIRQIVLDTETTGMNKFGMHYEGHKIIEIGAVEIINRCLTDNQFHVYLNPNRSVDLEAFRIHGINDYFLLNKPVFSDIADKFLTFIRGSELIIHNASFDIGFLNYELKMFNLNCKKIESFCTIVDSLKIARQKFPGQRNSLDALCERYFINKNKRVLHSALIDAQILAHIFLLMTGGQTKIDFKKQSNINHLQVATENSFQSDFSIKRTVNKNKEKLLKILYASKTEQLEHERYLDLMEKSSKHCLWRKLD